MNVDYQSTADQRKDRRRRRVRRVGVGLMVLAALAVTAGLLAMVEVRTDMGWVDARSGKIVLRARLDGPVRAGAASDGKLVFTATTRGRSMPSMSAAAA